MEVAALGLRVDGVGNIDQAATSLGRFTRSAESAETAATGLGSESGRATKNVSDLGRTSESSARGMSSMATAASRAGGIIAAAFSVAALKNYADTWSDMQSKVGAATGDMDGAADRMQRIVDIANASYSPLAQTAEVYARNVATFRDMGRSADEAADFTEALNHALVVTATKGQDADVVINSLSRSMAIGKLDAEAFDTIVSRSPRTLKAVADQMGVTTTALRALAVQGKVSGDIIATGMVSALEELRAEAADMPATVGDAFTRVNTTIGALVGSLDKATGASGSFAGVIIGMADGVREFTKDAEAMAGIVTAVELAATALAAVVAGRVVTALAASAVALYNNTVAARAKAAADLQAAQAAAALAAQELIQARAAAQASVGLSTHAAAAQKLAVAQTQATAATAALTAAQRVMTGTITAAGAAARVAGAAMAFLGGPLGIALIAAAAIYQFAAASSEASAAAVDLTKSVDELTEAQRNLAREQAKDRIPQLRDEISKYNTHLAEANKLAEQGATKAPLWAAEAKVKIEEATDELRAYQNRLADLNNYSPEKTAASTGEAASQAFEKLKGQLEERLALAGKATEAERLAARVQGGFIEGLKEGEGALLVEIQKQIDAREDLSRAAKDAQAASEKSAKEASAEAERKAKAAQQSAKQIQGEITALERAAKVWGMSADEVKIYDLAVKGASESQLEHAQSLLDTVSAMDQQKKSQEDYLGLVETLRTEDERKLDTLAKQLETMEKINGLSQGERQDLTGRMAGAAFESAPMPSGADDVDAGPLGELSKLADAERAMDDWYAAQMERLALFRQERSDMNAEWDAQELVLKQQHEDAMANIERARWQAGLNATQGFLTQLQTLRDSDSKKGRQVAKTAAIAQATINAYTAATGAYASASAIPVVGWVLGPIAAAAALAAGLANVSAIKGQAHDGIMSVPNSGTWNLEKGERVTTANTSAALDATLARIQYGLDKQGAVPTYESVRAGRQSSSPAQPGTPANVGTRGNVTVNQTNNFGAPDNRTANQVAASTARKGRIASARAIVG